MIFHENEYIGDRYVIGMSGGKDSTALALHMIHKEGIAKEDMEFVFMDTGWESDITYQYIDYLKNKLQINIITLSKNIKLHEQHKEVYKQIKDILGRDSVFVKLTLNQKHFATTHIQYCTRILKLDPLKEYYNSIDFEPINTIGIRKEESVKRSKYKEYEYHDALDCWSYRPILNYTLQDVIDIHCEYDVIPNNLYIKEHQHRVGCYPCIHSNKKELSTFNDKKRIQVIRILEKYLTTLKNKDVHFFRGGFVDDVLEWSKTSHGGKQFFLFNTIEKPCVKWGMCGI